jgi:pilus assembly protein CpaB
MNPLVRTLLIVLAAVALVIGVGLGLVSLRGGATSGAKPASEATVSVLVAARSIPSGSLLRADSMVWRPIRGSKAPAGSIVRGSTSEAELVGSVTRRAIDEGALLTPAALVRPNERDFLAAVLSPGFRAVTIATDPQQSASGLMLPGDRVDVILVRQIANGSASGTATGDILLRGVRIIAVGRDLTAKGSGLEAATNVAAADSAPKTLTLEVTSADAERLFVGAELGRLNIALRPLGEPATAPSVAADDLTPPGRSAVGPAAHRRRAASHSPAAVEAPAPVLIIRGSKGPAS